MNVAKCRFFRFLKPAEVNLDAEFDAAHSLYLKSKPQSEEWWSSIESMTLTGRKREHFSRLTQILIDFEQFPLGHELVRIATNGILFASV